MSACGSPLSSNRRIDPAVAENESVRPGSASVVMHYSMVLLPETPMPPRLFDERVGYFSTSTIDYGREEDKSTERRFITRYRLEKKDPNARVAEEGCRGLAAGIRSDWLQERDHRERRPDTGTGSGLEP